MYRCELNQKLFWIPHPPYSSVKLSAFTDAVRPVNQLAVGIPGALETACSGDRDVANASSVELSSELQSSRFSKIPKVSMNRSSFHPICDFSFDGHLD